MRYMYIYYNFELLYKSCGFDKVYIYLFWSGYLGFI